MFDSHFLKIPNRESSPEVFSKYKGKPIKAWVNDLPTANYDKASKLLLDGLWQLNRIEGDVIVRFEALELIRPAIYDLMKYLRARTVGTDFPLTESNQRIVDFALSVSKELAIGFWIVLQTSATGGRFFQKKSPLIGQRVLAAFSEILILHYLFKIKEPKGIWLDIHQLFQFQREKVDVNAKVIDKVGRKLPKTSLSDGYKKLILMRLAAPYSLLQQEILEISGSLEKWAGLTELVGSEKIGKQNCLLDCQQDIYASWSGTKNSLLPHQNLLDRSGLLRLLSDHKEFVDVKKGRFDAVGFDNEHVPMTLGLLELLEQRWSGREQNIASIFGGGQTRLFVLGLKAVHQHLNARSNLDEVIQSEWLAESRQEKELTCDFDGDEKIALGSLVAFRKPDAPRNRLALGIVCTLFSKKDHEMGFELQLMAGKPQAAGIQPVSAAKRLETYQRAILFFTGEASERKLWFVAETRGLNQQQIIRLLTNNETVDVQVLRKMDIGKGCYLFEGKPVN